MNTAIFIISVFGIANMILGLGMSRERRNREHKEEQRVTNKTNNGNRIVLRLEESSVDCFERLNMKKILLALLVFAVTGCVNETQANKALQDPITLNLVKRSIGDDMYQPYEPYGTANYVHNYYNSCSSFSRLKTSLVLFFHPQASGTYREISCDALDLRLNNKGWYDISASSLVGYYMDKLAYAEKKSEQELIKQQQEQQTQQVENMANGK